MKNRNITATASISIRQSKTGPMLIVRIVTPEACAFRTYRHPVGHPLDEVVASALRSTGVGSAWIQGLIPREPINEQAHADTNTQDGQADADHEDDL